MSGSSARSSGPGFDEASEQPPPLLKDQAYTQLKHEVITGHLPPGTFLSERGLSQELGMSKTPIRAALERLEGEGFVTVSARQGIEIRKPSRREIADQFELRQALERHVVQGVAGTLSTEQVHTVRAHLRSQRAAARRGDYERAVALDTEFHLLFPRFLGNQEILRVLGGLREKVAWVMWLSTKEHPSRLEPSWEEDEGIAEAVIEGRKELAVERLEAHLRLGRRMALPQD